MKEAGPNWIARSCFGAVFAMNMVCALQFILSPAMYAGSYELSGVSGNVAIQGIGITFLMWNATYPLFIIRPHRHKSLGAIILAQQMIGCVGEGILYMMLPAGHEILAGSISRFAIFDVLGLAMMLISYINLLKPQRPVRGQAKLKG